VPTLRDLLRRAGSEDRSLFRAELLDAKHPEERRRLESLLANPRTRVSDTLREQLSELLSSREPPVALSETALAERVRQRLAGRAWEYGVWAHYPWDERLVHVLPELEYFELRTDRNRHKITSAEQRRLRELRIGVIGLSAGQSIAITLAQEGIGSSYRLADFDRLTLSNTNRVRARVHELGLPKSVMTARAIAEIDPYVKVEIFPAGFGRENAQAFFEGDGERLDFLIEVCDAIDVKALARIAARERRVPVLMVNSEGGILDIERFDLEPDRPIFHGLAPAGIDPLALAGADLDTKVAYLLPIVGLDNLSDRMVASLVEVGSTVSTWPQLASGVMLGGALVSSALRRIALGELRDSGRYAVSLDTLIADGQGECAVVPAPLQKASVQSRRRVPAESELEASEHAALRTIAAAALAAPSGGNAQPCRFVLDGHGLEIHRRRPAVIPAFDPDDDAAWIAAGTATENAVLAAGELGWGSRIEIELRREPALPLVRLGFAPASLPADPLARYLDRRCTNRKRADPTPLAAADLDLLRAAAVERGARLELITEAPRRARLADCIGAADRLRLLSPAMLRDLASELRWTIEEVEHSRDGIDVRALELRAGELASLRLMLRAPAMAFLRTIGGGDRIRRQAQSSITGSPVLGIVACEGGSGGEPFFRGGRAIERLWLRASERGLSLAPMTTLLFLMRLAERTPSPLSADERREALKLKRAFDEVVPMPRGALPVFLFRLGRAQPPAARSIRKHLDDLVVVRT
jgi:molybdopterin/thiamine biosynthesis adenylyltransferase